MEEADWHVREDLLLGGLLALAVVLLLLAPGWPWCWTSRWKGLGLRAGPPGTSAAASRCCALSSACSSIVVAQKTAGAAAGPAPAPTPAVQSPREASDVTVPRGCGLLAASSAMAPGVGEQQPALCAAVAVTAACAAAAASRSVAVARCPLPSSTLQCLPAFAGLAPQPATAATAARRSGLAEREGRLAAAAAVAAATSSSLPMPVRYACPVLSMLWPALAQRSTRVARSGWRLNSYTEPVPGRGCGLLPGGVGLLHPAPWPRAGKTACLCDERKAAEGLCADGEAGRAELGSRDDAGGVAERSVRSASCGHMIRR